MGQEGNLKEVLDDLCARFLINLPQSEFESFERLFFAIESAHWFYEDFCRENDRKLPKLPLKAFAARIFNHTPLLKDYRSDVDRLTSEFKSYKHDVPTCGAAMLNDAMDQVVLVKGWGNSGRWGFPKGKVAKDETELESAVREVLEETGFDLTAYVDDSTFFIDSMTQGRLNRIFVVPGIPEDSVFKTQTRKEISAIEWVPVYALPEYPKKNGQKSQPAPTDNADGNGVALKKYFNVAPYTSRLRAWIKKQKRRNGANGRRATASAAASGKKNHAASSSVSLNMHVGSVNAAREDRGRRAEKASDPEPAPAPQGSPQKGKRSRKDKRKDNKDSETFGGSLSGSLSAKQKDEMYQNYVADADKRTKELSLRTEMWPTAVPGIPVEEETDKQGAREPIQKIVLLKKDNVGIEKVHAKEEPAAGGGPEAELPLFTFDVGRISSKMLG